MRRLALIPLFLVPACLQTYAIEVNTPAAQHDAVEITWDGGPARYVSVYRCAAACPDPASLPSYNEDAWPERDEVWRLIGMLGHHSVEPIIESPLIYGELPSEQHRHGIEPQPLTSGQYLVRVVRGEGNYFRASWGTGWSVLTVD